jgi:hypothetical protein
VPWGGKETALGMVAWCAAFVGVGLAFIPLVGAVTGSKGGFGGLSAADKSAFALLNQVMETVVSIGVIRLGVAKFEPLPDELFKYDFRCEAGWCCMRLCGWLSGWVAARLCEKGCGKAQLVEWRQGWGGRHVMPGC